MAVVQVNRPSDERTQRALHGMTRALINNMVSGVSTGFEKILEVNGVGYRAEVRWKEPGSVCRLFSPGQ